MMTIFEVKLGERSYPIYVGENLLSDPKYLLDHICSENVFVITNKKVSHGAPGVGASRSSLYVPLK